MTYDPQKHHRRSIRLKGYDYSQDGAYFLTICVDRGQCLLGEACDGEMILNWRGHIVAGTWLWLAEKYPHVELDIWQVMPNHFHGILLLTGAGAVYDASLGPAVDAGPDAGAGHNVGAVREPPLRPGKRKPVGRLVGAFKTVSTGQINRMQNTEGVRFWQRNFYDRVIRNERELEAIRTYIYNNPAAWDADRLHPSAPANRFNATWRRK